MTQEEIIEMARQAGMAAGLFHSSTGEVLVWDAEIKHLEAFAKLVAAKEREACAKVCEEVGEHPSLTPQHCAESIRARGEA